MRDGRNDTSKDSYERLAQSKALPATLPVDGERESDSAWDKPELDNAAQLDMGWLIGTCLEEERCCSVLRLS